MHEPIVQSVYYRCVSINVQKGSVGYTCAVFENVFFVQRLTCCVWFRTTDDELLLTINELEHNTKYTFTVVAENCQGVGEPGMSLPFTTELISKYSVAIDPFPRSLAPCW